MSHLIWLGEGIVGDDTDGHIDDIARFVDPSTVVCVVEADSQDENYSPLQENYERLQSATDQNGEKYLRRDAALSAVRSTMTARVCRRATRISTSPTSVVLVPVFDDPNDAKALGILQELFPERRVVGLRCNEVVAGLGAIHCVTQQEPSVLPLNPLACAGGSFCMALRTLTREFRLRISIIAVSTAPE